MEKWGSLDSSFLTDPFPPEGGTLLSDCFVLPYGGENVFFYTNGTPANKRHFFISVLRITYSEIPVASWQYVFVNPKFLYGDSCLYLYFWQKSKVIGIRYSESNNTVNLQTQ